MPIATNPDTGETVYLTPQGAWEKAQTAVNPQTKEMLAFDGQGWTAVPKQSKGVLGYIDDAVRSLASGVTFGFADELAAKADELTGRGGPYQENVTRERARDAQIPAAIAIPGQIAGAIGGTVAAAPIAAAAVPTKIAQVASRVPALARFGALGATEGAVAGAGNAVEGERMSGAGQGAVIGGVVGAVAPSVINGVSRVASGIKGAVSPRANVAADLGRAIVRDADDPAALLARYNNASIDRPGVATLADVGGENVRGLVERVAQTPGAGRTKVVPALTQRQQQQAFRISRDLRELTGTARTAVKAIDETMAERAVAAKPLYDEAFNFNARAVPEIVRAFENETATGYGKAVLNSGKFRKTLQTEYGIKDAADAPLMVVIDAWKKEVDDLVGDAVKNAPNAGRVLTKMRDRVLSVVDEFNPKYAEARNAWSGPSKYLDGIESGRGILSNKVSAEEFSNRFRALPPSLQEAERIGAVSSIVAKMGGDPAKLGDMTKYLRSPEMRAKIAAIMPTDEAAAAWARRLDFEVGSSELTGRALGNSATARRLAERADAENLAGDLVMDALSGAPQSLIRRVLGAGPKWLRDTMRSRADDMLADVLTNPKQTQNLPQVLSRSIGKGGPANNLSSAAGTAGGTELMINP